MSKAIQHPEVYSFLQSNHLGVLSTVNDSGDVWGSAIYLVIDKDFKLYFITRVETQKYKNIIGHDQVAITVTNSDKQQTVQLSGTVTKVPARDYPEIVFDKLASLRPNGDSSWAPPIEKIQKGDYIALCVTPTKMQYANYGKAYTDYDQKYIEIVV